MECALCGDKGEFDAIYNFEVVKLCKTCSEKGGIPVIKKPTPQQLQAMERPYTVGERLARLTGVKPKSSPQPVQHEVKKVIEKASPKEITKFGLIDHFQWHITRARRARGLSIRQFALALGEDEHVVEKIEQGALPAGALQVIEKIENFLKISLRNKEEKKQPVLKIFGNKENLLGKEIEIDEE